LSSQRTVEKPPSCLEAVRGSADGKCGLILRNFPAKLVSGVAVNFTSFNHFYKSALVGAKSNRPKNIHIQCSTMHNCVTASDISCVVSVLSKQFDDKASGVTT